MTILARFGTNPFNSTKVIFMILGSMHKGQKVVPKTNPVNSKFM